MTPLSTGAKRAMTVALAAAGTALFWALSLPLPFLFGPLAACLIAALVGAPLRGLGQVSTGMRTILGVAVGASFTPDVVSQLPQMAASVALIPLYIGVIGLVGVPYFRRVCGFDWATSWYAAMPGGLQDMILFGQEAGGDVRALSLIHATRVLIIVTLAPVILVQGFGSSLDNPIGAPAAELPPGELVLMVAAALIGWKGGERIGLFGASILGPMILTGALAQLGLIHFRPPAEAILAAQFFIGIGIGVGYVGVTLHEIRRDVLAGLVFVVILAALAAVFTEVVVAFGMAGPVEGFLAFAPGGQAEMTVLAIIVGADLGYVIVHHLSRVLLVITGAPIAARLLRVKTRTDEEDR
ncbi:AbrB family transcriptional regulator [Pseudoponticoccus marisrubri]|uniref:Aminopeptidase n=1 Tax=Pseudoponticoccus marisrubri TaxID=1685382 RepID=A0A0W7WLC3_9RHOB|nr:AbrB family transcriptional regulator [Pseudoponticoccus marisrubri]KUF11316.1 aminopeptidase [Pseudoponticoccus marisrubri]